MMKMKTQRCVWRSPFPVLVLLSGCLYRVSEGRASVMMSETLPRFSSSFPSSLPVSCHMHGADSSFFLVRDSPQEVMRNGSLSSLTQPLYLHLLQSGSAPSLSVNCSYGNITAEAPVPPELIRRAWSSPRVGPASSSKPLMGWKVKAHLLSSSVGAEQPQVHVLFYLIGHSWKEVELPLENLPCVRVVGTRDQSDGSVSAACRLQGILGMCVVQLGVPTSWFSPVLSRRRLQEPTMELHFSLWAAESGNGECPGSRERGKGVGDMRRIGMVTLTSGDSKRDGTKVRLDQNVEIVTPSRPVKQGQNVKFRVLLNTASTTEQLTLRMDGSFEEAMLVDFEMDNFITLQASHSILWRVEYPSTGETAESVTLVYVRQRDVLGIVPLAEDTEILNIAILTGQRVSLPVKVVTVDQDGTVREIDDPVTCRSTDEDVLKVSPACDEVFVNGKEMRGRVSVQVNFTYLYLNSQLELNVWVPRLPLQIDVSDVELSQVKGWRVPISGNKRPTRDSEDDDDDERKGKGCTLQYQYALVRVLTHFVAEPSDPADDLIHMLGPDWSADITDLVLDFLKVEDERIARLTDGRVLMGRDLGITTIQVISPLSDSILAERTITVLDDKVSVSDLIVQIIGSLSISLQLSPQHNNAIYITATANDLLHTHKQEAVISAWIQYSDGSVTPLDIYDPKDFTLAVTSLDEHVVSTNQDQFHSWPIVTAEHEGQGSLVRVEMLISETCQKSKRKSVLAMGVGSIRVKFGQEEKSRVQGEGGYGDLDNGTSEHKQDVQVLEEDNDDDGDGWKFTNAEEVALKKVSATKKSAVTNQGSNNKAGGEGQIDNPTQDEIPSDELTANPRRLSDLEIGMYALLGVFGLAILVFLINCISFAFRYRHKQLPVLDRSTLNHAHDWVWLGNGAELQDRHHGDAELTTTAIDRNEGVEESKYLLNVNLNGGGSQKRSSSHTQEGVEPSVKKRVKFTPFTTVMTDESTPYANVIGNEDDIKWVCQDVDVGTYMERLQDNL
ncbi:transmembrane protein 132D isoform X2 [Hemibagrus wyckioides]|uniref:transmembrane protein 132D isoform X2 n=1 Tax=Hemibagrus wyckioides TaxID=337641 RepID=UPI00266B3E43|nr:transmembrane protein 132D isoform X2 [Hemibagrus wyckioides]